ncbi:hypothetical protein DFQ28_010942 [Apophysomyces sp. BC1034]|nr:hypothetical protein DFQ30_010667 [Apophysomyces sp. BC1015]KAG0170089.1 hypothetical protein DFQ29_009435 [Apophysomyces sp. BC1021]KAG0184545.1 hypothetical protein DFQ28_010942 [Apophysomyces sp. BC1034]
MEQNDPLAQEVFMEEVRCLVSRTSLAHPSLCTQKSAEYVVVKQQQNSHFFIRVNVQEASDMFIRIVYRQDMPESLPPILFVKQLQKRFIFALKMAARAVLVGCVWLIVLPYFTVWIWRFYFWSGENLSTQLIRFQKLRNHTATATSIDSTTTTTTATAALADISATVASAAVIYATDSALGLQPTSNDMNSSSLNYSWIDTLKTSFSLKTFFSDCFEGQVITCVVVVVFVAAFLLREWIIQNIPADLLEIDEDEPIIPDVHDHDNIAQENQHEMQHAHFHEEHNEQYQVGDYFDDHHDQWEDSSDSPRALDDASMWGQSSGIGGSSAILFDDGETIMGEEERRKIRASSMPAPSIGSESEDEDHTISDHKRGKQREFIRATSMEPQIESSRSVSYQNDEDGTIMRGHPPHAPRIPHAETSLAARIQPTPERFQQQQDQEEHPLQPMQPLAHHNHLRPNEEAAVENNDNDDNDDNDMDNDNLGDDIDGVLEAVGMRGSLWMLAQNSALMCLLISLCLGATVWVPYLIGMMFVMTEILELIRVPLRLVRFFTDPLLDLVFWLCFDYAWPGIVTAYDIYVGPCLIKYIDYTIPIGIQVAAKNGLSTFQKYISETSATIPTTQAGMETGPPVLGFEESVKHVTLFINQIEPTIDSMILKYHSLASGRTAFDRFMCIVIGYTIVIIISSWYLSRTRTSYAAFGRTAQEAIRQQGIILKVGMFIAIELLLFPIMCGLLLDLSTMPLFSNATIWNRVAYLQSHPLSSVFLHWFLGTGFMFLFAVLVTVCREIVRPGVMWFIRDPNDPQFHPIKEIVERPVLTQLQKIGASGIMYAIVIAVGVGGVVGCVDLVTDNFLPLRWNLSQPLSSIPVDLIIIQVVIPAAVKYFEPKRTIKELSVRWISFVCRRLRLTSFMFGGRVVAEEGNVYYKTWQAWLQQIEPQYPEDELIQRKENSDVLFLRDGQLVRAPKHDSVPFVPGRRMLVPVDPVTYEPLNEDESRLGHPASSAAGGDTANTMIVYVPPKFRARVSLFLFVMWVSGSLFFCSFTIVPIALGRHIFSEWLTAKINVHDVYAYLVGGGFMIVSGTLVGRLSEFARDVWSDPSVLSVYQHTRQSVQWVFRWSFFLVSFGLILPGLFGLMVELYVLLPLKTITHAPSIQVLPMWTRGFACMSILHGLIQLLPANPWREHINQTFQRGVRDMDVALTFKKVVGPLLLIGFIGTMLPLAVAFANIRFLAAESPALQIKMIQITFPAALIGLGTYYLGKISANFGRSWIQSVREDNYLVGRTLHNLDE